MIARLALIALLMLGLGACASLGPSDPVNVNVVGVEPIPGDGMETRVLLKLRVQNPNEAAIHYTGVFVKLDVLGKTFATGVSDESGVLPGFSEAVVAVPVTVSELRMVRQVVGMLDGQPVEKIRYEMSGKLNGGLFGTERFESG